MAASGTSGDTPSVSRAPIVRGIGPEFDGLTLFGQRPHGEASFDITAVPVFQHGDSDECADRMNPSFSVFAGGQLMALE